MNTHTPRIQLTNAQLLDWRQEVREVLIQDYLWETLGLVAKGLSNKEVGAALYVSGGAIKKRLETTANLVSRLAPVIGVIGLDRTGLSTVYSYASSDGLRLVSLKWVDQVHAALDHTPGRKVILAQLPLGLTNAQIGRRNYLSERTIKTHLHRLRETLAPFADEAGVDRLNRTCMASIALMMGYTASAEIV